MCLYLLQKECSVLFSKKVRKSATLFLVSFSIVDGYLIVEIISIRNRGGRFLRFVHIIIANATQLTERGLHKGEWGCSQDSKKRQP